MRASTSATQPLCSSCGSSQTEIIDGLMYCSACGEQLNTFQEVALEDDDQYFGRNQQLKSSKTKRKTKEIKDISSVKEGTPAKKSKVKSDHLGEFKRPATDGNIPKTIDSYHATFGTIGPALKTGDSAGSIKFFIRFQILAKCVAVMNLEMGFLEELPKTALRLFKTYLKHCGAAFVDDEMTDNIEEMFVVELENKNVEFERQKESQEKEKMRKERSRKRLSQVGDAWQLLTQEGVNENLELEEQEDEESIGDEELSGTENPLDVKPEAASTKRKPNISKIASFKIIETGISMKVYTSATKVPLTIDLLVAILYISCQMVGCQWVLISDITRWVRENRFGITYVDIIMIGIQSNTKDLRSTAAVSLFNKRNYPLYEYFRIVSALWQSLNLTHSLEIHQEQILCRILHNLNLPRDLMPRILAILQLAPIASTLDQENLKRQGNIENGASFRDVAEMRDVGGHQFGFLSLFLPRSTAVSAFNSGQADTFFTLETKMMAAILMALKMIFRLDGKTEYNMKSTIQERTANFDVVEWAYQLKMRMMVWEGHLPNEVLQQSKPVLPLYSNRAAPDHAQFTEKGVWKDYFENKRECGFRQCIPQVINLDQTFKIPNLFPESADFRKVDVNSEDAIYMPLRYQTVVANEYGENQPENAAKFQKAAKDVFVKDYEHHCLDFESISFEDLEDRAEFVGEKIECQEMSEERKELWHRLFPSAEGYIKHPRPNYLWVGIFNRSFARERRSHANSLLFDPSEILPFMSMETSQALLKNARPSFSPIFADLLKRFAKIIGESEHVLYSAFVMLENQLIGHEIYKQLCENLMMQIPIEVPLFIKNARHFEQSQLEPRERRVDLVLFPPEPLDHPSKFKTLIAQVPDFLRIYLTLGLNFTAYFIIG
ncbi:hypothetical protein WR25_20268 isoform B [Diploscapter pachys]|uniref:Rrn7/TAF1B C-terminal cyclin domain-containing protein n=1 Tax=Diploscapter pachys TaxID=2018661 RepID=A0A2A2LPE3_9BILA|nr:hypothetical protein WR25_20268 isoform B [Diploscapter pachys]